jgi:hypothetical protein
MECFGIDLIEYNQQCFLAIADRPRSQLCSDSNQGDDREGSTHRENGLLARFHCPA